MVRSLELFLSLLFHSTLTQQPQIGIAYLFGARFDVAINELRKGKMGRPDTTAAQSLIQKYDRGEL